MLNPICQVLIRNNKGGEIVRIGYLSDYPLNRVDWSLEVGDNGSSCSITVPYTKRLADLLMAVKPFEPPTNSPATPTSGNQSTGNSAEAKDKESHIALIVEEAKRQGIKNKYQIAYILATADHESSFVNFTEFASGDAYEGRSDLGNSQPGDGRKFKGRGYVQLTGRTNYQKYSSITGKDLIANPDLVSAQPTRSFILVHGMINGSFTGAKLSDYTQRGGGVDYVSARAVINGDVALNGQSIASKAKAYENHPSLKGLRGSNSTSDQSRSVTVNPTVATAESDAYKILIRVGEFGAMFTEYLYLISDVQLDISENPSITVSGITPLWVINQYTQTKTLSNLSLKQLAERVTKQANMSLKFSGEGTKFVHLESNGLTDYQLLLRESKKAGYVISHSGTQMIMQPVRQGNRYTIEAKEIITFTSSIKPSSPLPQSTGGLRGTWDSQPTIKTDVRTGTLSTTPVSSNKPNKPATRTESNTTGNVTLASGQQVSESAAQSEVSRVQDNPSVLKFIPQVADLLIAPTDMIQIRGLDQYSEKLAKIDFWVSSVSLKFDDSGLVMEVGIYQPGIEVKEAQELSGSESVASIPANGQGFIIPMKQPWVVTSAHRTVNPGRPNHHGVDLAATGSDKGIYASASGIVTDAESSCVQGNQSCGGGYGNVIQIKHADGYTTLYGHQSQVFVRVGQQVKQGERIGIQGSTGRSTGDHCHFEIKRNGSDINPMSLAK